MSLPALILASGSAVRAHLLRQAGLSFKITNSQIDEDKIKEKFAERKTSPLALKLAEEKALAVSRLHPGAIVIGADQILSCEGQRFDKPKTMAEARENLLFFRGRPHVLHSGVVLAKDDAIIWGLSQEAKLTMRVFTHDYLDHYLAELGEKVMTSVGCYQLEGPGIQLFHSIEGDYFTILGLPLLPLLAELRRHSLVMP